MQNKTLQEQLTRQDEQNQHDRGLERKEFEDQKKMLQEQVDTLLADEA